MATNTEVTPAREPGPGQVPVLVTRLGGQQRIFPVGAQVRVGRDPAFELVSVNPLVSRQCHGVITSDQGGATYVDRSRRGTFLDGRQLSGPLRITESVVLRLGDPATGEELGITPPLTSAQIARNHGRRILGGRMRRGALVGVAVAAVAGLATFGFFTLRSTAPASGPSASVLQHAEAATVRLMEGSPSTASGWGSGTLISPTGLILTNVHVAEPQAPGFAVGSGLPRADLDRNPPYLTVEMTDGPSSPVVARYRARPVAADGYLDLATVQIYATASGRPVSPGSLHLPYLKLGNVAALQLDQNVTVLGFPGVADSDSITVTSGVLSTFVPDPQKHVTDPRFELETTARVAHGNSGGAAITDAGQLIGVPSLTIPGEGNDTSWRLRSVAEARPLIAAARAHSTYKSKILVQPAGTESVTQVGVGDPRHRGRRAAVQGADPDHLRPRRLRLRRAAGRRQRLPAQRHPAANLVAAIHTIAAGDAVLAPTATTRLVHQFAASPGPEAPSSHPAAQLRQTLTSREQDVFSRIAAGMSNSEIAASLFLSEGTVKIHVGRILAKLGLRDRVQAVVLAYESGVITPGTPPPDAPGAGIPRTV
jgi:putative serine protease PepD